MVVVAILVNLVIPVNLVILVNLAIVINLAILVNLMVLVNLVILVNLGILVNLVILVNMCENIIFCTFCFMMILQYDDHHKIIPLRCHISRILSSQKIYVLYGLQHHIVEIIGYVSMQDGAEWEGQVLIISTRYRATQTLNKYIYFLNWATFPLLNLTPTLRGMF